MAALETTHSNVATTRYNGRKEAVRCIVCSERQSGEVCEGLRLKLMFPYHEHCIPVTFTSFIQTFVYATVSHFLKLTIIGNDKDCFIL